MFRRPRTILIISAALAAASLAACDRPADAPQSSAASDGPSVGARVDSVVDRTKEAVGDATITAKVKGKLIADDQLKATQIDVDTSNGTVTLRGSVASPGEKDRAASVAREVEGVHTVDNQLNVHSGSS